MATEVTNTKVAAFDVTIQNRNNDADVTSRTVSFDLPYNSEVGISDLATIASTYFTVAGMSNVFQPTSWRDYKGLDDVYIMKGVTPILTEKTESKGDYIEVPASVEKKIP